MKEKVLNLKPFDLEAAKNGKPVCTRDGRKARIICFDRKGYELYPILAFIEEDGIENYLYSYKANGMWANTGEESKYDLMMHPEKHVGWVNVYKDTGRYKAGVIFPTKEDAINTKRSVGYVTTAKIEWEE